jgi:hypothetical protein
MFFLAGGCFFHLPARRYFGGTHPLMGDPKRFFSSPQAIYYPVNLVNPVQIPFV